MSTTPDQQIASLNATVAELEHQLAAVRRIANELSTFTKVDELLREALDICLDIADADAGSIILYNPKKNKLVLEYVVGPKQKELTGLEIEPDQGLAGRAFRTGETRVYDDVGREQAHLKQVGEKVGYVTTNMVTVALKSPDRNPIGCMQILNKRQGQFGAHDVTLIEIMAAETATAIENARLHEQARLATVINFIGDISHDVKNMVTPAKTGADTLQMIAADSFEAFDRFLCESTLTDEQKRGVRGSIEELRSISPEMLEIIMESCDSVQQRMAEIAAAIKGIVSAPQFETTDIKSIASRVTGILSAQAQKDGITLAVESACESPKAVVDPKQIYNAIYNLIFNAIDACDEGASVTLRIACRPDGEFPEGNCITIECADTGPGMPDHVKAKLFTDEAISTKPMGTGLGTRIIKNVVDAHGGAISLETEQGVGTTITCKIPACRETAASA